jgi:hypothetical protein
MSQEVEQANQEQSPDKVLKQFEGTIKKLVAIMGSDKSLYPSKKVQADDLSTIVTELLAEERQKNTKEVSDQLKALLKGYTDLKSEVKKKQEELKKLEQDKMKEINKAAQSLFSRIEALDQKEKDFYSGLKAASEATTE